MHIDKIVEALAAWNRREAALNTLGRMEDFGKTMRMHTSTFIECPVPTEVVRDQFRAKVDAAELELRALGVTWDQE
jgi:hypothetical protein